LFFRIICNDTSRWPYATSEPVAAPATSLGALTDQLTLCHHGTPRQSFLLLSSQHPNVAHLPTIVSAHRHGLLARSRLSAPMRPTRPPARPWHGADHLHPYWVVGEQIRSPDSRNRLGRSRIATPRLTTTTTARKDRLAAAAGKESPLEHIRIKLELVRWNMAILRALNLSIKLA